MATNVKFGYCTSSQGILKWIEIIFCCVALGLVADGVNTYGGYTYILAEAAFCIAATFILLLLLVLGLHWKLLYEKIFNLLCFALNAAAFGVAVYCTVVLFGHAKDSNVTNISGDWKNRMAAVSAFTGAAALLYLYDALLANRGNIS